MVFEKLYEKRFEIFLATQLCILFGSLFFPPFFFETKVLPVFFLLNILAGILMIYKRFKLVLFFGFLFAVAFFVFGMEMFTRSQGEENTLVRLWIYFVFHLVISATIVGQVWKAKEVTRNVIIGLISGYISLGFLGFFLFMTIELLHPGAFSGTLMASQDTIVKPDSLLYYAYITLLTIGYGEIVPVIPVAQKAAILVGLVGQFYLVIVTAVVIEKYIRHSRSN